MEGTRQRDIKGGRRGITPLPSTLMTLWLPRHLVSFDHLSTMTTVYLDLLWLPLLLLGKASIFSVVTHYSYVCLRAVVYCIGSPQSMYDWLVCGKCPMVGVEWWARRSVADGRGQEPDPSIPSLCGHAVARLALVAPSADRRTEYLPQMIKRVLDLPIVIRLWFAALSVKLAVYLGQGIWQVLLEGWFAWRQCCAWGGIWHCAWGGWTYIWYGACSMSWVFFLTGLGRHLSIDFACFDLYWADFVVL